MSERPAPYGIVYLLTNTVNGKQYVGQTTKTLEQRFRGHCKSANRKLNMAISKAIAKHGASGFMREALFEAADLAALNAAEIALIEEFGTIAPAGYNLKAGGDYAPHHPETLARIASLNRGRKHTDEHRAKIAAGLRKSEVFAHAHDWRRGSHHTDEHREKISASLRGVPKSPEHAKAAADAMRGRSAPWAAFKTPEHIAKIAAANRGKKRSAESRARMSEAAKRSHQAKRIAMSATV